MKKQAVLNIVLLFVVQKEEDSLQKGAGPTWFEVFIKLFLVEKSNYLKP